MGLEVVVEAKGSEEIVFNRIYLFILNICTKGLYIPIRFSFFMLDRSVPTVTILVMRSPLH